jgi:peptidoglycan/xylan/chitin deacetylase (PgdA/CDA1 family)
MTRRLLPSLLALVGALVFLAIALAMRSGGHSSATKSQTAAVSAHHRHRGSPAEGTSMVRNARPQPGWRPFSGPVPILVYHDLGTPPPTEPYPGLFVSDSDFRGEMAWLHQAGYQAVTLDEMMNAWYHGGRLPPKPIVITFDNGYHSQYARALPVLRKLGWVADENMQLAGLPPSQGGLTTAEVKAFVDAGWELDTQGISHADLITLDTSELRYQIATARRILQRRYDVPVNWFCYPSGHYDATVIDAVRAAGFVGSTTVVPGWASPRSDPYRLPRLRVLGGTSPAALLEQIASTRTGAAPPSSYGGA